METREVVIAKFIELASSYSGRAPEFKLTDKGVVLLDSTQGFLKKLMDQEKVCVSLSKEGLSVEFFKA